MNSILKTILFGLWSLSVAGGMPMAAAGGARAALQDFEPASDSYWSERQAAAFTAAVQAHLFSDEEVEWVERSELDAAVAELALSRWGGGDEVSRLQIGQWLRADFMVNGAFAKGEDETTWLTLEIVEVDRADVVAVATLILESDTGSHPLSEIERVAHALRTLLAEGREQVAGAQDRPVIAPVVFANTDVSRRLDVWEVRIPEIWRALSRQDETVRVLNLSRPRDAEEERRLSLLGLKVADDPWKQVADLYVWGEYEEVEFADRPFEEVVVEFRIHLWSGAGDPETITQRGKVNELESVIAGLGREVFARARAMGETGAGDPARAAEELDEQANRLAMRTRRTPNQNVPDDQRFALENYRRALLELGIFFDPDDPERSWELAQFQLARGEAGFPAAARRAGEMLDWCRRHLRGEPDTIGFVRIREALLAWAQVPAMLDFENRQRPGSGIPRDTPPQVIAEWRRGIEERLVREVETWIQQPMEDRGTHRPLVAAMLRGLETMESPELRLRLLRKVEPVYHAAVRNAFGLADGEMSQMKRLRLSWVGETHVPILRVFMDLGVPEEGVRWLGLDFSDADGMPEFAGGKPGESAVMESTPARPLPKNPDRPRVPWDQWMEPPLPAVMVNDREALLLEFAFSRPVGPARLLSATHRTGMLEYDHMVEEGAYVWMAGRLLIPHHVPPFMAQLNHPPRAQTTDTVLFRYDRRHSRFEQISIDGGISAPISGMTVHRGDLWLITAGEGALRRAGSTGAWTRYRAADGLVSDNLVDIAVAGDRLAFVAEGAMNRLIGYFDPISKQWMREDFAQAEGLRSITGIQTSGEWAVLTGSTPHLVHIPSGRLSNLAEIWQEKIGQPRAPLTVAAAKDGFWILSEAGTFFLDPANSMDFRKVHSWRGSPQLAVADGDDLWIGLSGERPPRGRVLGGELILINRENPDRMSAVPLVFPPLALASTKKGLWLATEQPLHPVWKFQKPTLPRAKSTPELSFEGVADVEEELPLIRHAMNGNTEEIRRLMEAGESPNVRGTGATTPLHAAIVHGCKDAVGILLEGGADPNAPVGGENPVHPLFTAAERNLADIVRLLLRHGARIDEPGPGGGTALMAAVRARATESLLELAGAGADPNVRDGEQWTALHHAALHGYGDGMKRLLDHGADLNAMVGGIRTTPLGLAMGIGAHDTAFFLLARGARAEGDTQALTRAVQSDNPDLVRALLERGAPVNAGARNAFATAVMLGSREIIQAYYDYGYNAAIKADEEGQIGSFALVAAVNQADHRVMEELLRQGLDPNHSTINGRALERAVAREDAVAVRILLAAGADPMLADRTGSRIMETAPEGEIRDLLEAGRGDVTKTVESPLQNISDYDEYLYHGPRVRHPFDFLLTEGLRNGHSGIALQALRAGADPDAETPDGWPAMLLAAASEDSRLIRELISRGADINRPIGIRSSTQSSGFTALHQAVVRDNRDVARVLLDHNALLGIGGGVKTPIEMAEERGRTVLLEMFHNLPDRNMVNNAVTAAIYARSLPDLQAAVDQSPDLNLPDADFRTPLGVAVSHMWRGRPAVPLLLQHGADPNRIDPGTGAPPLLQAIALEAAGMDALRQLLEHGADPAVRDDDGNGVAEYLEKVRNHAVREMLREMIAQHGGNDSSPSDQGRRRE